MYYLCNTHGHGVALHSFAEMCVPILVSDSNVVTGGEEQAGQCPGVLDLGSPKEALVSKIYMQKNFDFCSEIHGILL